MNFACRKKTIPTKCLAVCADPNSPYCGNPVGWCIGCRHEIESNVNVYMAIFMLTNTKKVAIYKSMECPYCGSELLCEDCFGRIAAHQDGKVLGDIYRCPNGANQDATCETESFHVAGSFYTYREGDESLHEGYPC